MGWFSILRKFSSWTLALGQHLKRSQFGYLVWCFPSAGFLQKLPVAKTLFVAQVLWGFILIGTGFAHNFATLVALRVLLGVLEAPILPGNFLILGMWYSRRLVLLFN